MSSPAFPTTPITQTGSLPTTPRTGTWRHPRLEEITQRQNAARFTDRHVSKIVWNCGFLILSFFLDSLLQSIPVLSQVVSPIAHHAEHPILLLRVAFFFNILVALYPLVRRKDDFSDIALTPSQRALLGLDPNITPSLSPGGTYITPPRYTLSSPRTGTPVSRGSSFTNSPLSGNGSPSYFGQGGSPFSPSSPSPLLQKAIGLNGRDATRRHSYGSQSPLGASKGGSLVSYPSTPSPTTGKGAASVGLNNRWLYERGRGSPGGKAVYS